MRFSRLTIILSFVLVSCGGGESAIGTGTGNIDYTALKIEFSEIGNVIFTGADVDAQTRQKSILEKTQDKNFSLDPYSIYYTHIFRYLPEPVI